MFRVERFKNIFEIHLIFEYLFTINKNNFNKYNLVNILKYSNNYIFDVNSKLIKESRRNKVKYKLKKSDDIIRIGNDYIIRKDFLHILFLTNDEHIDKFIKKLINDEILDNFENPKLIREIIKYSENKNFIKNRQEFVEYLI
jgi:hypothetical protein